MLLAHQPAVVKEMGKTVAEISGPLQALVQRGQNEGAETPELLKAVNEANLNTLYGRAMWTGRELVMAIDVPAPGTTAEAISFACFAIGSAADHSKSGCG